MPSPRWHRPSEPSLFAAITAAAHEAWAVPEERRRAVFAERVRQVVGPERADAALVSALHLFNLQSEPPAGWETPPSSALFRICPGCAKLRKAHHNIPNGGRLHLQLLRDADWLAGEFARGRNTTSIARRLKCEPSLVAYWAEKHGLDTPRTGAARDFDAEVAARHRDGDAPGTIARALSVKVQRVRQSLSRQGIATMKRGHHYMQREWWEDRIVRRNMSAGECAKEAGIQPHACAYWLKRFELQHITKARGAAHLRRRWRVKYPPLADPAQLRALLDEHGTYEAVARVFGCAPTLVSQYARKLLGEEKRHRQNVPHAAREWWTERLDRGATTWALAEEAGIEEKTAREKLRVLGAELLAHAYRNNVAAEKARRRAA